MPVDRGQLPPFRKSRRLRNTDPKDYRDDELWEQYDEALLASVPVVRVKTEPDDSYTPAFPAPNHDQQPMHIRRPRNAFICFRSDYVREEKRAPKGAGSVNQTDMSCSAGEVWRSMSDAERAPYILQAQREKEEHALKYPGYRYSPGNASGAARKPKKAKTQVTRRASSTSTSGASSDQDWSPVPETRPAASPASRRKSRPTHSHRPSPTLPSQSPAALSPEPVASAPTPTPSPPPAPQYDAVKKYEEVKPQTLPTFARPASYDLVPMQFGFKRELSPTVIQSLALAAPQSSPSPPLTAFDAVYTFLNASDAYASAPPAPSPPPSAQEIDWSSWLHLPAEMNEGEDLQFQPEPHQENFGFFYPFDLENAPSGSGTQSLALDDILMT